METMSINKLYKAAAWGDVAALEEMQKQNADILAQVFYGGNTALHISAFHGRRDFVKSLIRESDEEAANEERPQSFLRAQNEEENSALHEAVKGGDHAQIVEVLIEADAELAGIRNKKGESALFTVAANGRFNALKMLLPKTDPLYYARFDGQTCLHHALFYKNYGVAEELIEKAPDLCKQADFSLGETTLHIAAFRGSPVSILEKLLQCDPCSPFNQNKIKQQTALHLAAQHGHANVVRCILRFAENCAEIRDENGRTALHYAVENAQVGIVRYLVRFPRVVNIADNNGYTAFDIAIQKYHEEPLSPYFAIRLFLRNKKAIEGMEAENQIRSFLAGKKAIEGVEAEKQIRWFLRSKNAIAGAEEEKQTRETSNLIANEEKYSTTINSLSVCAILIATVTFQAAFTLPPHEKDNRALPTFLSHRAFESFVLLDWLAFCFSMSAAIVLAYATFLRRHRSLAVGVSAFILPLALYMMMFSFSIAIFLQLRQDYYKLAAFFFYAMFMLAPTTIIVILLVLYSVLGFRILELIPFPFPLPGQGLLSPPRPAFLPLVPMKNRLSTPTGRDV